MLLLSIVAQYNKPNKPKNHTNTSVYYLLFVKWNFVFTLRNSGPAKTGPAGPIPTPLAWSVALSSKCIDEADFQNFSHSKFSGYTVQ